MSTTGTFRGAPKNRNPNQYANNPSSSSIPRPALEHIATAQSEAGTSSLSTSRQKQTKRDEVRCFNTGNLNPLLC